MKKRTMTIVISCASNEIERNNFCSTLTRFIASNAWIIPRDIGYISIYAKGEAEVVKLKVIKPKPKRKEKDVTRKS